MKVYVFARPDGSIWADYKDLGAREGYTRIRSIELATRGDMESAIKSPGNEVPERVRALADRALDEHMRHVKPSPPTRQQSAVVAAEIEQWSFLRRMKWLFTGR